ncbi:MAG TPA: TlpA disulfide reductase family protein [Streptosporangiaceae bacterium]|nr:TlpA disulfide reductase family protein [Streptosporangiaceae bacterium]
MTPATPPGAGTRHRGRTGLLVGVAGVVAVVVAISVIGATSGGGQTPRTLGQAKSFTLSVLGHPGQQVSLAAMHGRPVILNFFASWCDPCQRETPLIARFYRARHGDPAVIGIDSNDPGHGALAFVTKNKVTYPVVTDPLPGKTALAYGLPGLPATFFLNAQHQIVKRVFGAVTEAELSDGAALMTRTGR